jgi:hypothetical protein
MSKVVVFSAILFCCSRCTSPSASAEKNADVARKMFEAFNQHEWESMATYYVDSALFLDPSFGKEYVKQTRHDIVEKYKGYQQIFPDIHDEVVGVYPSGDMVIVEFISTGNSADGISFKLPIITALTFKEGLIIKDATYYDLENP